MYNNGLLWFCVSGLKIHWSVLVHGVLVLSSVCNSYSPQDDRIEPTDIDALFQHLCTTMGDCGINYSRGSVNDLNKLTAPIDLP